jgi:(R,R)-butanediol dehydrogenase/meso-butanediol dehydrogenase/diacetyl reductase
VAARSAHRADLARAMGADSFLVSDDRLGEAFADAAGAAPDVIYECVGTPGMMQRASDLAPIQGEIIMAGACNGHETLFGIPPTLKELTYRYAACYTIAEFAHAQRLIATGAVNPMPMFDGTVSLDALPQAFEALRADKSACKLMVAF